MLPQLHGKIMPHSTQFWLGLLGSSSILLVTFFWDTLYANGRSIAKTVKLKFGNQFIKCIPHSHHQRKYLDLKIVACLWKKLEMMFISFLLCLHWICSVWPHSSHILGLFFFYLRPGPTMPPCLIPLPPLSIVDLFIIYLIPYQSSSLVI